MQSYYDETRVAAGQLAARELPLGSLPEARMSLVRAWIAANGLPDDLDFAVGLHREIIVRQMRDFCERGGNPYIHMRPAEAAQ